MIKKRIQKLINKFDKYKIDGYVIPKNDELHALAIKTKEQ